MTTFMAVLWIHSSRSIHVFQALWIQELDAVLLVRSCKSGVEGENHTAGHRSDVVDFVLKVPIAGSCPNFPTPVCPSPSPWGCSQPINPLVCNDTGDCPDSTAGSCTWPCRSSIPQGCQGPPGWQPFPQEHQSQEYLSALCHLQTCWLSPTTYVTDEDIK